MKHRMTTRISGAMVAGAAPAVGRELVGGIEPAGCLLSEPSLCQRDQSHSSSDWLGPQDIQPLESTGGRT